MFDKVVDGCHYYELKLEHEMDFLSSTFSVLSLKVFFESVCACIILKTLKIFKNGTEVMVVGVGCAWRCVTVAIAGCVEGRLGEGGGGRRGILCGVCDGDATTCAK